MTRLLRPLPLRHGHKLCKGQQQMQQAEGVNCADEQPRRLLETKFPKAADELTRSLIAKGDASYPLRRPHVFCHDTR